MKAKPKNPDVQAEDAWMTVGMTKVTSIKEFRPTRRSTQKGADKRGHRRKKGARSAKGQTELGGTEPTDRGQSEPVIKHTKFSKPRGLGLWAQGVTGGERRDDRKRGSGKKKRKEELREMRTVTKDRPPELWHD